MKTISAVWQITVLFVVLTFFPARSQNSQSYTLNLPEGYSLLANQLNNGNNLPTVVFTNTAGGIAQLDGSYLWSYYDCEDGYFGSIYQFDSTILAGAPDPDPMLPPVLVPGAGFAFYNSAGETVSVTFTGSPNVPVLPVVLACGEESYYLLGRQTNDVGTYENITGYAPAEGAQVKSITVAGNFVTNFFTGGAWTLGTPSLGVGQAAFFFIPAGSVLPFVPSLGKVSFNSAGALQFAVNGNAGYGYRIWATTNPALSPITTTWTLVASNTFTGAPVDFTDAQATNFPLRFYTVTVP